MEKLEGAFALISEWIDGKITVLTEWVKAQLGPISERLEEVEQRLDTLEESDSAQDAKIRDLYEKLGTEPIDPPIEPPINPELGEVEIVSNRALIPGSEGFFEAVVSTSQDIETVTFFVDGNEINVERQFKYESKFTIPQKEFEVSVKLVFKNGAGTLAGSKVFSPESGSGSGGGNTGGGNTGSGGASANITEFNDFVTDSDGTYYSFDADTETARTLAETEVESLFNTANSHMGKPDNRAKIQDVPGLTGRKGFSFIINSESGGFGDRFSTHKTNGINENEIDYYPQAGQLASYSELFFDSSLYTMRTHFKCSSFSSASPPASGSNTTDGSVRTTDQGEAELVRWEFYDKNSQPLNDPERKGDVMKLYFGGTNTNWSQSDYDNLMDTQPSDNNGHPVGYLVMGAATYCAHPMTYAFQNMIYPCKPDSNGLPTTERLLMPTDRLIKSWMIWTPNTVVNGVGQYDGEFKWWLQIDDIVDDQGNVLYSYNEGQPFQAAIVENFLWVDGQPLVIESGGVGAYFNSGDEPNNDNQFFVLKDEIYYTDY